MKGRKGEGEEGKERERGEGGEKKFKEEIRLEGHLRLSDFLFLEHR